MVAFTVVFAGDAFGLHQRQRNRVADGEHHRHARARRQPDGARFFDDSHVEDEIGQATQFGIGVRGNPDDAGYSKVTGQLQYLEYLAALAAG